MQKELAAKICVRLPNWLGDTVMSLGFLKLLQETYPSASISVITKKGLEQILALLPGIDAIHVFSKDEYKGLTGVWRFGKSLAAKQKFDLFFVLPESLSSAVMAYASGATKRIGFRKEGRNFLLTHSYKKPRFGHRVEQYAALLQLFNPATKPLVPQLHLPSLASKSTAPYIVINTNSESVTSRLPLTKAIELITLFQQYQLPIKLIGSKKELPYVTEIVEALPEKKNIEIVAGKTNLQELTQLIQQAFFVISSDSGPAHIAIASGLPIVIVTGAGDERNTGPYQNPNAIAVRNGTLPCEPCVKNHCKFGPLPLCLLQLDLAKVKTAADFLLTKLQNNESGLGK